MNILILILLSVVVLSILVVVHEFGHFIIAKRAGVLVEEFGIGIPPRVWGKKIGETLYSINAIPLGGFVRLHGETGSDTIFDPKRAYINKHPLQKAAIVIAGIVMNFVFGVVCFAAIYSFIGVPKIESLGHVEIVDVSSSSAAQTAGIISGDIVKTINNKEVKTDDEFVQIIADNKGKKINLVLLRNNEEIKVTANLKNVDPKDGALGVAIRDSVETTYFPPLWQRPFVGAYYGVLQSIELSKAIFTGLGGIAQDATAGKVPQAVAGPVKLFAIIAYFISSGLLMTVNLMAVISINLAIFNILPIPPLDGSRLATIIGEAIFGRKMAPKIENFVNTAGMALLLILVIAVTFREVPEFIQAGSLAKFVEGILQ
ncbi:MAG: M50 family metallopeptidase [Patescibacteria group bacterium]